ncbi:MAG: hypothetical protein V7756_12820 [Halopseudomonas sp.]|uniref:hypothetical protein n=1 Tax=Halopseudomonas sp. TaxID=2901191 RepID=UPI0030023E3F
MKSYMVVYTTGAATGRFFVDTQNRGLPTSDQIESWEKIAAKKFGHKDPAVVGFFEVAYPAAR